MKKAISKRVTKFKKQISELTEEKFQTPKSDNLSEEFKKPINNSITEEQKKILSDMLDVIDTTNKKLDKALNYKPKI